MTSEPERVDSVGDMGDEGAEIDPYLWDGSGEPDPVVAELEKALHPAKWSSERSAGRGTRPSVQPRFRLGWRTGLALAATLAIVAGGVWFFALRGADTGWRIELLAGAPGLDGRTVASGAVLRADRWLRTDANSRARLHADEVGDVTVEPDSDVRLLTATKNEHRLELAQGSISAFVKAPPKIFFVNTPAAEAVDMGCAYKLNVDKAGAGTLYVSLGWVELHADSGEVRVPAGAACRIGAKGSANPGPGTPWFEDAEPAFAAAVDRLDAGGGGLGQILDSARVRDSLTLWHLAARLTGKDRDLVTARLAQLVPPPQGVNPAGADAAGLEQWWGAVRTSW